MKKYKPGTQFVCPKCGHDSTPRVNYAEICIAINKMAEERINVICRNCGYYEPMLPLDAEEKELKEVTV